MVRRGASVREIRLRLELPNDMLVHRACAAAGLPSPKVWERQRKATLADQGLHWCGFGPDELGHIVPLAEAPSGERKTSRCKTCRRAYFHNRTYACTWAESWAFITESQRCAICGATENLVQDHCHRSGERRDVLCSNCNTALGMLQDDPQLALNAFMYLSTHRA